MSDDGRYTEVASLLVLGLGLTGLFLGVENWWVIFAVGYAAVVPLVAVLTGEDEEATDDEQQAGGRAESEAADDLGASKRDALETLRERYAQGELTEEQFERKVETLLDTETLEDARSRVDRGEVSSEGDDENRELELE